MESKDYNVWKKYLKYIFNWSTAVFKKSIQIDLAKA
jgi:hypothetical protein